MAAVRDEEPGGLYTGSSRTGEWQRRAIFGRRGPGDHAIEMGNPFTEGVKKQRFMFGARVHGRIGSAGRSEAVKTESLAPRAERPHDSGMTDLTREELDAKLDRTESRVDAAVARLETQFSEFRGEFRAEARHNSRMHQFTLAAISIFAVLMIGGAGFVVDALNTRMDRIEGQVDSLPAELRGIADSITSAITATQSGQPQTIIIERPPAEPPPPEE